jgi:hypothetical protein
MMDLDEFTHLTITVLEEQDISTYAPTLIIGEQVQVIQGIPEGMDHRVALQDVIRRMGLQHAEFLFGVRSGPREVTTGQQSHQGTRFRVISSLSQGFSLTSLDHCPWWKPEIDH